MKYQGVFEEDFRITSGYGWRISPITGKREFHDGIDIASPLGRVIFSPFRDDGVPCKWQSENAGSVSQGAVYDRIRDTMDNKAIVTFHEERTLVKEGDLWTNRKGYAVSGNTGKNTTGAHTHFCLEIDGKRVDPEPYLDVYIKNGQKYLRGVKWNPQPPVKPCEQELLEAKQKIKELQDKIAQLEQALREVVAISTKALN